MDFCEAYQHLQLERSASLLSSFYIRIHIAAFMGITCTRNNLKLKKIMSRGNFCIFNVANLCRFVKIVKFTSHKNLYTYTVYLFWKEALVMLINSICPLKTYQLFEFIGNIEIYILSVVSNLFID